MKLGNDPGASCTKVFALHNNLHFASVVGPGRDRRLIGGLAQCKDTMTLDVEFEGVRYFVGELARRESWAASVSAAKVVTDLPHKRLLALTGAALVSDGTPITMVTGLPIADYMAQRDSFAETLLGNHALYINGQPRDLTVKEVEVFPQAAGALWNELLDLAGRVVDTPLLDSTIACIDVGGRDTGWVVLDAMEYVDRDSDSAPIGVYTAHKAIAHMVSQELGIDLPLQDVPKFLTRHHPDEKLFREYARQAYDDLATRLIATLTQAWPNPSLFARVVLCGGGAELVAPRLKQVFPTLMVTHEPFMANAKGYYKVAQMRWRE